MCFEVLLPALPWHLCLTPCWVYAYVRHLPVAHCSPGDNLTACLALWPGALLCFYEGTGKNGDEDGRFSQKRG